MMYINRHLVTPFKLDEIAEERIDEVERGKDSVLIPPSL